MKSRNEIIDFSDCWENLVFLLNTLKRNESCKHSSLFKEVIVLLGHMEYGAKPHISPYPVRVHLDIELTRSHSKSLREYYRVSAVFEDPKEFYDIIENLQEFISYEGYYYSLEGSVAVSDNDTLWVIHEEQECGFWVQSIRIK